jgi:demethylmenaquinone methyltransferase / 2-methoxy-6-polyprenyl-1,4-benzoquinol methylase
VQVAPPDRRNSFAQRLFAPLPSRYDRLAELLSFGQNGRWRRAMVDHLVPASQNGQHSQNDQHSQNGQHSQDGQHEQNDRPGQNGQHGQLILDVAAGTAGITLQLARRIDGARVIGVDLTEQMLRQGARNVATSGQADRIALVNGRAEQLPFPDASFDALTFSYLLRYVADPEATLAELARVVRPGGTIASLEFLLPPSRFWRFWWRGYTAILLPLGGLLTGGREWFAVGRFLGPSIAGHYRRYPVSWTVRAWQQAGLTDVGWSAMSLGGGLVMWGTRTGG